MAKTYEISAPSNYLFDSLPQIYKTIENVTILIFRKTRNNFGSEKGGNRFLRNCGTVLSSRQGQYIQ
jgi:hypothetical protein